MATSFNRTTKCPSWFPVLYPDVVVVREVHNSYAPAGENCPVLLCRGPKHFQTHLEYWPKLKNWDYILGEGKKPARCPAFLARPRVQPAVLFLELFAGAGKATAPAYDAAKELPSHGNLFFPVREEWNPCTGLYHIVVIFTLHRIKMSNHKASHG